MNVRSLISNLLNLSKSASFLFIAIVCLSTCNQSFAEFDGISPSGDDTSESKPEPTPEPTAPEPTPEPTTSTGSTTK